MSTGHIGWSPDYKSNTQKRVEEIMQAKPAPDPGLALIRELRDALVDLQKCVYTYGHSERVALIARATAYLREHGADNPEARTAIETAKARLREAWWAGFGEGTDHTEISKERHAQAKNALYEFERTVPEKPETGREGI